MSLSHAVTVPTQSVNCSYPAHSQAGTALRRISLECACACLFREAAWSLPHGLPSLVISKGGAAIADPCRTLILHCCCIPTQLELGLASLFTAYTLCMQVLPLLLRTRVPGWTAYPHGAWDCLCYSRPVSQRDCLPTLAFHVNVYALITPPAWSKMSLSQPPMQGVLFWSPWSLWRQPTARSPCVVIDRSLEKAHSCGPRGPAYHLPFGLSYLPPLWRAARPRSESSVGGLVIIIIFYSTQ